jgi:hypothetical protein
VPDPPVNRLLWTLLAFFLAMGVGAHALDELNGRPLQTAISDRLLVALAVISVAFAAAIGIAAAFAWTLWLLPTVAFGVFLVVAYNLELFGGRFHSDTWFALAWGAFPLLCAYLAVAERLTAEAGLAGTFAALLSLAQRRLSTQVRSLRRHVATVTGRLEYRDGRSEPLGVEALLRAPEAALRALTGAVIALAAALLVLRLA